MNTEVISNYAFKTRKATVRVYQRMALLLKGLRTALARPLETSTVSLARPLVTRTLKLPIGFKLMAIARPLQTSEVSQLTHLNTLS